MYVRGELERLVAAAVRVVAVGAAEAPHSPADVSEGVEGRDAGVVAGRGAWGGMSVRLLESWWDRDNWCVLLQRVD